MFDVDGALIGVTTFKAEAVKTSISPFPLAGS